jgi:PncC family amidohydrolase
MCDETVARVRETEVGKYVYDVTDGVGGTAYSAAAGALVREMRERGLTLGFAESCTGGLCAKMVTDVPGASSVIRGGFVTYATDTKVSLLGVSEDAIERYGVVSEECAKEMAEGTARALSCDVAVSVTGVAGPGPEGDLPAGHVCFGICVEGESRAFTVNFGAGRSRDTVRTLAALRAIHTALDAVREM